MWKAVMKVLSLRKCLMRYRLRWRDGSHGKAGTAVWIFLPQSLSAENADAFTVRKSGIPLTGTRGLFISAVINTKTENAAELRI